MFRRVHHVVAISALVLSGAAVFGGAATATPGPGTFTTITTPSHTFTYHFNSAPSATNTITVSGHTSSDVTSVDIDCIFLSSTGRNVQLLASAVTVTGNSFSTVAAIPDAIATCRLRAIPTGVDLTSDDIGSYSGPIMYMYTFATIKAAGQKIAFQTINEFGTGIGVLGEAAQCGVGLIATLILPEVELRGPGNTQCAFALTAANLTNTGTSTAPAIRVDGKNAYLPASVSSFLRGTQALTLTQSAVTLTFSRNSTTGNMTVTESAPLKRCNGDNTYPPTSASCSSLVGTGVTFKRTLAFIRGAHQVEIHDSFVSADGHSHTVTAQYQISVTMADTGAPGYIYPGHGTTFHRATPDQVITGFGSHPTASVLVRSDIFASSVDEQADTQAYTWSRPPNKIQFAHGAVGTFAMPYTVSVPAHGAGQLAFAESEAPTTTEVKALAAKAVADL